MRRVLESGHRSLTFDYHPEDPYEVDVWFEGEPVWTLMVAEEDVKGNLVLIFPALPKEHFAYEVELTPRQYLSEHKVVAPAKVLTQLVTELRLSRDDLVRTGRLVSEVANDSENDRQEDDSDEYISSTPEEIAEYFAKNSQTEV